MVLQRHHYKERKDETKEKQIKNFIPYKKFFFCETDHTYHSSDY